MQFRFLNARLISLGSIFKINARAATLFSFRAKFRIEPWFFGLHGEKCKSGIERAKHYVATFAWASQSNWSNRIYVITFNMGYANFNNTICSKCMQKNAIYTSRKHHFILYSKHGRAYREIAIIIMCVMRAVEWASVAQYYIILVCEENDWGLI